MDVSLALKYASRHVLKRNPQVLRWRTDLRSREYADPLLHRQRQEELLAGVLRIARRIPAYEELAARAPERDRLGFLREAFPLTSKASLLAGGNHLYPDGKVPRHLTIVAPTSGTTGTPLDVHRSFGSILREEAFHLQHWHWAGWQRGERQAVLRGDIILPIDRAEPPYWFHDTVGNQLVLSTRHLGADTALLFARELQRFGATQLRAYPSAAYELAGLVQKTGIPIKFKSVITGSEVLYDFQRRLIEKVFDARVFDFYSMAERVAFAAECVHGRMHVNPEYGILEIVDEAGRPTNGVGNIVGTSLHNHAMPLFRYRMDDTARWSFDPCPCGRTYPVIAELNGRLADQLYDLDGRTVNCTVIGFAFDGLSNIQRAQVAQVAADQWVIRIVPGPDYTQVDGERVLATLARDVSARVAARIELVENIPVLPSGKYKWVTQEHTPGAAPMPLPANARSAPRAMGAMA